MPKIIMREALPVAKFELVADGKIIQFSLRIKGREIKGKKNKGIAFGRLILKEWSSSLLLSKVKL